MLQWLSKGPPRVSQWRMQVRWKHIPRGDKEPSETTDSTPFILHQEYGRHLFRALIRECTYLPDVFARQWMRQHIASRFRTYVFKTWQHQQKGKIDIEQRLKEKREEARKALSSLQRANAGHMKCLLKVLFMAYGRT